MTGVSEDIYTAGTMRQRHTRSGAGGEAQRLQLLELLVAALSRYCASSCVRAATGMSAVMPSCACGRATCWGGGFLEASSLVSWSSEGRRVVLRQVIKSAASIEANGTSSYSLGLRSPNTSPAMPNILCTRRSKDSRCREAAKENVKQR